MKDINALLINDNVKVLSSLKFYLKEQCKSITAIYTSSSLILSEEVIKEKKPEIIILNMSFVDSCSNIYLSEYFNNINCAIIYFNTVDFEGKEDEKLDCSDTSQNESKSKEIEIKNFKSIVYGLSTVDLKELVDLINKAIILLLKKSKFESKDPEEEKIESQIIAIPSSNNIDLIAPENILYLEADGNYTTFHLCKGSTIISSRNLGHYDKQLDSSVFF
jgi:two-component system LytT family response regulator